MKGTHPWFWSRSEKKTRREGKKGWGAASPKKVGRQSSSPFEVQRRQGLRLCGALGRGGRRAGGQGDRNDCGRSDRIRSQWKANGRSVGGGVSGGGGSASFRDPPKTINGFLLGLKFESKKKGVPSKNDTPSYSYLCKFSKTRTMHKCRLPKSMDCLWFLVLIFT